MPYLSFSDAYPDRKTSLFALETFSRVKRLQGRPATQIVDGFGRRRGRPPFPTLVCMVRAAKVRYNTTTTIYQQKGRNPMPRKVTLNMVAARAGVSRGTVDRVLNEKPQPCPCF